MDNKKVPLWHLIFKEKTNKKTPYQGQNNVSLESQKSYPGEKAFCFSKKILPVIKLVFPTIIAILSTYDDGLLMILSVFSKLNDSVILYIQAQDY